MAKDLHTISLINGTQLADDDRLRLGILNVANPAGGGAGAAVAVAVVAQLPANAFIVPEATADVVPFVTQTPTGFTLTLNPRLAANNIAAGNTRVLVLY